MKSSGMLTEGGNFNKATSSSCLSFSVINTSSITAIVLYKKNEY